MPFVDPPIKVAPLPDESPTSWIIRICLKYRISLRDLISIYDLQELMKEPVNITADLSPLSIFLPEGTDLPNTVLNKIESFQWKKGRSDWLIHPNKKGSVMHNSYTRICPKCLKEKGYYQLKWQLSLIECCIEHSSILIDKCTNCKDYFNPFRNWKQLVKPTEEKDICKCQKCLKGLSRMRMKSCATELISQQIKIQNGYSEKPVNVNYLLHKIHG